MSKHRDEHYHRYHIEIKKAAHIVPHPHRFCVKVKKTELAKLLIKEIFHSWGKWKLIRSRPCVYGVFSGPVGGFAPRESLCVGCLRCTTEYPEMATVLHNPERKKLGDSYFTPDFVDTIVHEAESGRIPIKGAGYRGLFGGKHWDSMWTDMSEIVRPTRDGIHGREFISTIVDIGGQPLFLNANEEQPDAAISIPIPLLFDMLPVCSAFDESLCKILSGAAKALQTFAVMPFEAIKRYSLSGSHIIPSLSPADYLEFKDMGISPAILELAEWDRKIFKHACLKFPNTLIMLRSSFENDDLIACYNAGAKVFHLTADYHGKGNSGKFVMDLIREAHMAFVKEGCRDQVSLIGSGGIIAAEHLPKALICGLDSVAIDTSVMAALQANFNGECISREQSKFIIPEALPVEWGKQRLKNLVGAWHDQLLEILGAMGLREVRRLRGELGRAMFQADLEKEAFTGITNYET